jgi:acyl-coenzyme A thioesterase PaaI-like protein
MSGLDPDTNTNWHRIPNWFAQQIGSRFQCFGCSPHNPSGLGVSMAAKEDGSCVGTVEAVGSRFESFPGIVHGGVIATLIDDSAYWTLFHNNRCLALTKSIKIDFKAPAHSSEALTLRCHPPCACEDAAATPGDTPSLVTVDVVVFVTRQSKQVQVATATVQFVIPTEQQLQVLGDVGKRLSRDLKASL